jgi:hypothetical protein
VEVLQEAASISNGQQASVTGEEPWYMDPVVDPMADRAPLVAVAHGVGPALPVAVA